MHDAQLARALKRADHDAIRRILHTSDYIYVRFDEQDLPHLLATYPAVGAFLMPPGRLARVTGGTLEAFLLANWLVPPSLWIGGFGVAWSQSDHFEDYLDLLLPALERDAGVRGARAIYYSGHDSDYEWMRDALEARGFTLICRLRSYDKAGFTIPAEGAQTIRIRPFTRDDVDALAPIEQAAFAQLWRHDAASFLEVAETYPYFVVAEDHSGIVGYQFNTIDRANGYLVRVAVHPRVEGHGVGTRLLAEAVRYFASQHVTKILLNTEESNTRAQALYERFDFHEVAPRGFVLGRPITESVS